MSKKIVTLFTMAAFMVFSLSCYSTRAITINIKSEADLEGKELKIVKVQTFSGENIIFPKGKPGWIYAGTIVGSYVDKEYSLKKAQLKKIDRDKNGKITHITTEDERSFYVIAAREEGDRIIFRASDFSHIPLSEVNKIWVKKFNLLMTIGLIWLVMLPFALTWSGPSLSLL